MGSVEGGGGGGAACLTPLPLTLSPAFSGSGSTCASGCLRATPAANPAATEIGRQGKRPPRLELTSLATAPVEKRSAGAGDAEAEPFTSAEALTSAIPESLRDTRKPYAMRVAAVRWMRRCPRASIRRACLRQSPTRSRSLTRTRTRWRERRTRRSRLRAARTRCKALLY